MKKLVVNGRNGLCVEQGVLETLGPDQVQIKNRYSLISSGTELHYIDQCKRLNQKLDLGYCVAGKIVGLGEAIDDLQIGQAAIAMGWGYAIHAEYVHVPKQLVVPVLPGTDLKKALFANLLATAVHANDRAELTADDRILVIGAGLVGRLVAATARTITPYVTITDKNDKRLAPISSEEGLITIPHDMLMDQIGMHSGSFSKAFICIRGDATEWIKTLVKLLHQRGNGRHRPRIIGVGRYTAFIEFSVQMGNMDIVYAARCGEGYRNDSYVHGLHATNPLSGESTVEDNLKRSLRMISQKIVPIDSLISKIWSFDDILDAYESITIDPGILGVIVEYSQK